MARDPYAVLGVSKTATQNELKAAYRNLAKKLHPDLNPGNKDAELRFKELNDAYMLLGDPKTRAEFDRSGQAEPSGGPGRGPFYYETQRGEEEGAGGRYTSSFSFGGEGMDDLFEALRARQQRRGFSLEIAFKDAALGAEKELRLPDGRRLRLNIPAGVASGARLRVPDPGGKGAIDVELTVRPSAVFRRAGHDLEVELPVSVPEAVLGAEVRVPVIDGAVLLKIPPGVTTGSRLRLRGKGLVDPATGRRGDQHVIIGIALPDRIDAELRELAERWRKKHAPDPRGRLWNELAKEGDHAA